MAKVKRPKPKKRHIEDVPFYNFKYEPDDLPLDPAQEFILEEIGLEKSILLSVLNLIFFQRKQ